MKYDITIENNVKVQKTEEIEGINEYEAIGKIFCNYGLYRTYFRIVDIKQKREVNDE